VALMGDRSIPASSLGPGLEFDTIRRILAQHDRIDSARIEQGRAVGDAAAASDPRIVRGPGDDCALVNGRTIAISVDVAVEGIHFERAWVGAHAIGYRAAAAALSDLAAAAASPIGILVTVVVPSDSPDLAVELMAGVSEAALASGAALLGGDLSGSTGPISIATTAVGETGVVITRAGARPGDEVWVTGRLGGAASAVAEWKSGGQPGPAARASFERPEPRIAEAQWLAGRGLILAAIDVSDGLAGDVSHLATASGVRILLDVASVPAHEAAEDRADRQRLILSGGEDYELLFVAPPGRVEASLTAYADAFPTGLTRIGRVVDGHGVGQILANGTERELGAGGYTHFDTSASKVDHNV
jgi:thiamine-monophosphate kinase